MVLAVAAWLARGLCKALDPLRRPFHIAAELIPPAGKDLLSLLGMLLHCP
jgi:hypothetical protein